MKKVLKYSFVFLRGGGKGTTFMLVILAVSYFAHNCHKFKLLFSEYKCLDHSGIYTRKNGGSTQYIQALSKFKRHKDTTKVMHTLKCLVFYVLCHSGLFFAGKVRSKRS